MIYDICALAGVLEIEKAVGVQVELSELQIIYTTMPQSQDLSSVIIAWLVLDAVTVY